MYVEPGTATSYDVDRETTWEYGCKETGNGGKYTGIDGTDGRVQAYVLKLNGFLPGTYHFTALRVRVALAGPAACDGMWFCIYKGTAAELTLVDSYDISSSLPGDNGYYSLDCAVDMDIEINDTDTYYATLVLSKIDGAPAGYPGVRRVNDAQTTDVCLTIPGALGTSSPEATINTGDALAGSGKLNPWMGGVDFTTTNKTIQRLTGTDVATGNNWLVAHCITATAPWHIKLTATDVTSGNSFDFQFADIDVTNGNLNVVCAGQRAAGLTEDILWGGTTVNETAQNGEEIDFLLTYDPGDGKSNLFWVNTETGQGEGAGDWETHSHTAVATSAHRGAWYTFNKPEVLKLAGTFTADMIEVGIEPMIYFGDSQMGRLIWSDVMHDAWTHDHITWKGDISGNRLTKTVAGSHTAMYLRIEHSTPGKGDIVDMRGVWLVIGVVGINDISAYSTSETVRPKLVAEMTHRLSGMVFAMLNGQHNGVMLMGSIPWLAYAPYGAFPNAARYDCVIEWARAEAGIAYSARIPYLPLYTMALNNAAWYDPSDDLHISRNNPSDYRVLGIYGNVQMCQRLALVAENQDLATTWPGESRTHYYI